MTAANSEGLVPLRAITFILFINSILIFGGLDLSLCNLVIMADGCFVPKPLMSPSYNGTDLAVIACAHAVLVTKKWNF